jgi:hypothetical protein
VPVHERFRELGSLAAIGQVSESEDRELRAHWCECRECRDAYSDYCSIVSNHLPNLNPVRFRLKNEFEHPAAPGEIRARFMARAKAERAQFSSEVETSQKKNSLLGGFPWSRMAWIGAVATMAAIAISGMVMTRIQRAASFNETAALRQQNQVLRSALQQARTAASQPGAPAASPRPSQQDKQRVNALQRELAASAQRTKVLETQIAQLGSLNATLVGDREKKDEALKDLQARLAREENSSASTLAALVEAQDKIQRLNAAVNEGAERLSMERQLASASSDVRQLMGARNLHIVDVHDVNPSGKTDKSFGRVFYAENKSLVFYAFDLPSSKSAKYSFQAWGQTEGNERSIHNIGTFSVDDHEQRRWVLKVNDPAVLKGIDSVFVTAETGSSPLPRGKRVLYAYFAGQANHP